MTYTRQKSLRCSSHSRRLIYCIVWLLVACEEMSPFLCQHHFHSDHLSLSTILTMNVWINPAITENEKTKVQKWVKGWTGQRKFRKHQWFIMQGKELRTRFPEESYEKMVANAQNKKGSRNLKCFSWHRTWENRRVAPDLTQSIRDWPLIMKMFSCQYVPNISWLGLKTVTICWPLTGLRGTTSVLTVPFPKERWEHHRCHPYQEKLCWQSQGMWTGLLPHKNPLCRTLGCERECRELYLLLWKVAVASVD